MIEQTDTAAAGTGYPHPLAGRRIAITRPLRQAADLTSQLEALGAQVTALAAIAIAANDDTSALDSALARLGTFDWLVFTSVNGVMAAAERLAALGIAWDARGAARVAAIGPATAAALAEQGVAVDLVPEEYVAEGILAALGEVAGQRLLLARADIARQALAHELRARGAVVTEVAAYRTVTQPIPLELLRAALMPDETRQRVDAITFTSSSTVRGFLGSLAAAGMQPAALDGIALAAIGPITAQTLREDGLEPTLVAEEYTIPGLVRALVAHFGTNAQTYPSDTSRREG